MIRRFFKHIKEGFVGVKRHLGMAMSSASAVTITLLLVGLFLMLSANLSVLTKEIESSISLLALIDYNVTDQMEIDTMKGDIEKLDGVLKVEYHTKDQEFDDYLKSLEEDEAAFYELYRETNPFHDVFLINAEEGEALASIKTAIAAMPGIESVRDGGSNTYLLIDILRNVRLGGGILVLALCVLAVYLIYNTIKITISSRQDEIWIMRNVGARNGYIRAPFLVEGVIIANLGSIIPIAAMIAIYLYLYNKTGGLVAGVIRLIPPMPFLLYLCLTLLGIGIVVGFIGSYISVCKYLRLRR
ncbi:MAG: permease-like cell division protein FtsX [Erysipelotrichaceae bacterium]|nr:permease-like cell division protein FtsX [Erysipelotrichaceae bacterium]